MTGDAALAVFLGLMGGVTVGVCAAPLWMMLQIPMRLTDILNIKADMRLCGLALAIGAAIGAIHAAGFLPEAFGVLAMALGGMFVGMLASALAEAVEEMPAGYADKMACVIHNIPMLIVMLILVIPVALLAMHFAEKALPKQASKLR